MPEISRGLVVRFVAIFALTSVCVWILHIQRDSPVAFDVIAFAFVLLLVVQWLEIKGIK